MTVDRSRIGAVCGPSQPTPQSARTNNDADQQAVLPLLSITSLARTSALLGLPEDLVDLKSHALARRADLRDGQPPENRRRQGSGGGGAASPRSPLRATTRQPGGRAGRRTWRLRRGLPPGWRVVGLRQADGTPHDPRRARSHSGRRWAVERRKGLRTVKPWRSSESVPPGQPRRFRPLAQVAKRRADGLAIRQTCRSPRSWDHPERISATSMGPPGCQ